MNAVAQGKFGGGGCTNCILSPYLTYVSKVTLQVPVTQPPAAPSYGKTKALVHSQFPAVQVYNFTNNPYIDATVTGLSDVYLARLTRQYYIETNGAVAPLMAVAAKKLSAANLLRFKASMGQAATDAAVNAYSSPTVKAGYFGGTTRAAIPRSEAMYLSMGINGVTPAPNLDMTLYEVFLDYLTAGETTAASALASTAAYAGTWLSAAATVGYQIGTVIYWIDDQVDPDINIWIGDELGAITTDIINFALGITDEIANELNGIGDLIGDTYQWNNEGGF
jgi:hypothetical protein